MIRLIQGDCIEVMQELIEEEVKIDLILTDLPYGTTANKWDTPIDTSQMWKCIRELSTPITTTLLFGTEPFSTTLRIGNLQDYKYDLYWIKNRATGFAQANNKPLKNIELISVFSKGTTVHKGQSDHRMTYNPQGLVEINKPVTASNTKFGRLYGSRDSQIKGKYIQKYTNYPRMTLEYDVISSNKCLHPTQKPLPLIEYLIRTYSNQEDTVLDFCMGSGTVGVACKRNKRNFIGVEINKDYYELAQERIKEVQMRLI